VPDVEFLEGVVHPVEELGHLARLSRRRGRKAVGGQRLGDERAAGADAPVDVGEEVDILGRPVHEPVGQERVAAAEREAVPVRHAQRDPGHANLERVRARRQAARRAASHRS
jgi:hypothetical protein